MYKSAYPSSVLSAIGRHKIIAALVFTSVSLGASLLALNLSPRLFETKTRVVVGEQEVGISSVGQALSENTAKVPGRSADPVATQAELIKSPAVLQRALTRFRASTKTSAEAVPTLTGLQSALKVSVVPATNILEISLKNSDPEVAATLLNEVAKAAVQENTDSIRSSAATLRKFLEKQVIERENWLRQIENAERRFRQQTGIVSFDSQAQSLVGSLADLENEERTLRSQLQSANTQGRLLQQVARVNSPAQAYASARVGQNESLKAMLKQIDDVNVAIVDARSRLGDRHPDLLALLQKRDELQALYTKQFSQVASQKSGGAANVASNPLSQDLMARYITGEIERKGLESRLRTVQADLGQLQSRILQLPASQQSLAMISRQRTRVETELNQLKDKLEESRIAEGQILSNVRVIGEAQTPSDSISPKPLAILLLSTIVGLLSAAAIVALLELLDSSLRNASDTEASLNLPILAIVPPTVPENSQAGLEHFLDNADQVEPYRSLLKTLEASGNNEQKIIVCSSSVIGEGKSAVSRYLATVAASLGQRTLLIDADLRNPVQQHLLHEPTEAGLTEVIGGLRPFRDAIQTTDIPNLFVLPAGQYRGRPSTTIEAFAKSPLLREAIAHYDLVLIDASPLNVCTDAITLSQKADGLFLVVRPHFTQREVARQTITKLNQAGVQPLGVVVSETVLAAELKPVAQATVAPPPPALMSTVSTYYDLNSKKQNTFTI